MDKNIPIHIAIIMDGNGRWARQHGRPRSEGHRRGMTALRETIKEALKIGVKFLTVYAFSSENWKRPKEEVSFLMQLCEDMIIHELPFMMKNGIRLRHIGRREDLPPSLQNCIADAEKITQPNERMCLQLAFNYGARMEITEAIKKLVHDVRTVKISLRDITEEKVAQMLYTHGIPDPDLLIRTGGEKRISNFLLWQLCYSELYFIEPHWPDFNGRKLRQAVADYQKRKRRFGGLDG